GTFSSTQSGRAVDAARRAIKEQLTGMGINASVGDAGFDCHRVFRATPATWPRVSVVASSRQHPEFLFNFIKSLLEKTDYPDMEVIVVYASESALSTETSNDQRVRLVRSPNPADFVKTINETARRA